MELLFEDTVEVEGDFGDLFLSYGGFYFEAVVIGEWLPDLLSLLETA